MLRPAIRRRQPLRVRAIAMTVALALLGGAAMTVRGQTAPEAKAMDIGSRLELFVDDVLVESMSNLSFELHSPRPAEGVIPYDQPWEAMQCHYAKTFKDGDLFRMYYACSPSGTGSEDQYTCYAESKDGIHWTKPTLNLVEYQGSTANNIVWKGLISHNLSPFRDTNPNARPDELYKAVGHNSCHYALASPDGIHWRLLQEKPVLTEQTRKTDAASFAVAFDTLPVAFWDEPRSEYVLYSRSWTDTPAGPAREMWYSTSKDFLNWSVPELLRHDVPPSVNDQLYTNGIQRYFRAPHLFVGFPMRFVPRNALSPDAIKAGLGEAVFICSRDGRSFHRYLEPLILPGRDRREWSKHSSMIAAGLLPTGDDEISVYYTQNCYSPVHTLQRGVFRTDGFVSLHAPFKGGEFTTKPLVFAGAELVLNVATGIAGGVRVELQNEAGTPFDGYRLENCTEFYGDEIAHPVTWANGSDLRQYAGQPVRLRLALREADLYSLQFRAR
jgi:hypothetical protein